MVSGHTAGKSGESGGTDAGVTVEDATWKRKSASPRILGAGAWSGPGVGFWEGGGGPDGRGLSSPTCLRDRRGWPMLGGLGVGGSCWREQRGVPGIPPGPATCPAQEVLASACLPRPFPERSGRGPRWAGWGLSHQPWGAGMNQHPHLPPWALCVDVMSAAGAPGPGGRHRAQSHPGPGPSVTLPASPHSGSSWGHQAGGL